MKNINEIKTYKEFLEEKLNEISDCELLSIYGDVMEDCGDKIYDNSDEENINMLFSTPDEAVRAVCYGEYNYMSPYFKMNAYGNLQSIYHLRDEIFTDEVAENIIDQNYDCYLDEYNGYLDDLNDDLYDEIQETNKEEAMEQLKIIENKEKESGSDNSAYDDFLYDIKSYLADHLYEDLNVENIYDLIKEGLS